jgi:hypothetical protein
MTLEGRKSERRETKKKSLLGINVEKVNLSTPRSKRYSLLNMPSAFFARSFSLSSFFPQKPKPPGGAKAEHESSGRDKAAAIANNLHETLSHFPRVNHYSIFSASLTTRTFRSELFPLAT